MEIRVLKVRHEVNRQELDDVIEAGHTIAPATGYPGWQMPATAEIGDLAVWYSGSPVQEFVAYGWVCGPPVKPGGEKTKHYGPVCAVRKLPNAKPRAGLPACSFMTDPDQVVPLAQTVPEDQQAAFLRALGFPAAFVTGRDRMSAEVARSIGTVGSAR